MNNNCCKVNDNKGGMIVDCISKHKWLFYIVCSMCILTRELDTFNQYNFNQYNTGVIKIFLLSFFTKCNLNPLYEEYNSITAGESVYWYRTNFLSKNMKKYSSRSFLHKKYVDVFVFTFTEWNKEVVGFHANSWQVSVHREVLLHTAQTEVCSKPPFKASWNKCIFPCHFNIIVFYS